MAGRPTDYKEDYARQAEVACAEGGFTDKKLAKLFGVAERTIYDWKNAHPEFLQSIKKGKDAFNVATAEDCLLKRITGFEYTETTKEKNKRGQLIISKTVKKHVPSDPTSIIFFLKNRDPERWRDSKHIDFNDKTREMTDDQLDDRISKLIRKTGASGALGGEGEEEEAE